jgi:hypothetical protein
MHPLLTYVLAVEAVKEVRLQCELEAHEPAEPPAAAREVTIRTARSADLPAVRRLAELEEKTVPLAPLLVAEVEGTIEAALPVEGGEPVANPFAATADVIPLLELRAAQLRRAA